MNEQPTTEPAARSEPAAKRYRALPSTHAAWHRQAALSAAIRGGRLITSSIARVLDDGVTAWGSARVARAALAAGSRPFWRGSIVPAGSGRESANESLARYAEREVGDPPVRLWESATTWPIVLAGAAVWLDVFGDPADDDELATLDAIDYLTNPTDPTPDQPDAFGRTCDDCGRTDGTHNPDIEH